MSERSPVREKQNVHAQQFTQEVGLVTTNLGRTFPQSTGKQRSTKSGEKAGVSTEIGNRKRGEIRQSGIPIRVDVMARGFTSHPFPEPASSERKAQS